MHWAKFVWNWPSGYGEDDFLNFINVYRYFVKLSPLGKGRGPSFVQTWIPFTQGCFVSSLVKIGSVDLEKKKYFVHVFLLFRYYLPLEKGRGLHLKKLESPSSKDALCQVWIKLAQWFWRRFLNFVNVFSLFPNYLPLEKGGALHLKKLESPSPRMFCAKFGWNWPSGSGEDF